MNTAVALIYFSDLINTPGKHTMCLAPPRQFFTEYLHAQYNAGTHNLVMDGRWIICGDRSRQVIRAKMLIALEVCGSAYEAMIAEDDEKHAKTILLLDKFKHLFDSGKAGLRDLYNTNAKKSLMDLIPGLNDHIRLPERDLMDIIEKMSYKNLNKVQSYH